MTISGDRFRVQYRCELLPCLTGPPLCLSRKRAKTLLKFGAVRVAGKRQLRHDTELEPGDVVVVEAGKGTSEDDRNLHGLRIVYIDDAVVVVDKPSGLLSMGSTREKERTAWRILNEHLKALGKTRAQQIFIVHRLDRETSGLMVFARSETVRAKLQRDWKSVTKKYLAAIEGTLPDTHGTLRDNLAESRSLRVHRVDEGGELAITHYRVLVRRADTSLLELTLETGRKNQIRVQLSAIGHPIVGDRKYGARTDPVKRLALHSYELKFEHPLTGAPMEFRSSVPNRLKKLLERR